jgi:hypothetical protein
MKGFKLITGSEKRRLRRELKQMWSTVPPHALPRARELAGVQAGKEHEFRVTLVKVHEETYFMGFHLGVNLCAGLVDDEVNGEEAKLLRVQLQCDGREWQIKDGIYAKRFQSSEQLNMWLASIEKYLSVHLSQRLLDACFFVWDEAVAKASDDHGVRKIDLTALAEAHLKDLRRDKTKALAIKRGAKKGSKQSKVKISPQRLRAELPIVIRELGDPTREQAAKRFGLKNGKALYRLLRSCGDERRWNQIKADAWAKE